MTTAPVTADFIEHAWHPLRAVTLRDGFVHLDWPDGMTLAAYSPWLAENAEGYGLEPTVRESMLDPADLPRPEALVSASVDHDGALLLGWDDRLPIRVHPGWLRHVAEQHHLPTSSLPPTTAWTTADFAEPPTIDGSAAADESSIVEAWLATMIEFGMCRLANTPTDPEFLGRLVGALAPLRDTNFGPVWSVRVDVVPGSTANTGLALGQHTDLPTRETPPGFQFLHCIENTVTGGWSRLSDGLSVVAAIRDEHPEAYTALTELEWVFVNRSPDAEHRWIGPIIDLGSGRQPLTLRAFYPVRLAPHMAVDDVARGYEALRVFSSVASDPRFMIRYPFRPGDLLGFDNRRVLHGRDAFESAGSRHLRGCYADHDDIHSRLRVLRRPHRAPMGATT